MWDHYWVLFWSRYFGAGASFYHRKALYEREDEAGLTNKKPISKNLINRTPW